MVEVSYCVYAEVHGAPSSEDNDTGYWFCADLHLCRTFIIPPLLPLFFPLTRSYLLYLELIPICLVLGLFIFCHHAVERLMLAGGTVLL